MEELQNALQEALKTLRELPIGETADALAQAVDSLNNILSSEALKETPKLFNETLVSLRDLSITLNREITPLTDSLRQTSDGAGEAISDLRIMIREEEGEEVIRLADSLDKTLAEANALLHDSRGVVDSVDTDAIKSLVRELSAAARSIRVFADYLDRHPEALIRGKTP